MPTVKLIPFLLIWFLSTILAPILSGRNAVNTEDVRQGHTSMNEWPVSAVISKHDRTQASKEVKQHQREEKFIARFQKAVQSKFQKKHPAGISDPVDKWFWIWAIAWSLGIIMTIIAGGAIAGTALGIIWLAAFVIGSVALILWLVKKYG